MDCPTGATWLRIDRYSSSPFTWRLLAAYYGIWHRRLLYVPPDPHAPPSSLLRQPRSALPYLFNLSR